MKSKFLLLILLVAMTALIIASSVQAAPLTFTVNSAADPGTGGCDATECTLREAIFASNTNSGFTDTIVFNISITSGPGPHTISLGSSLPTIY